MSLLPYRDLKSRYGNNKNILILFFSENKKRSLKDQLGETTLELALLAKNRQLRIEASEVPKLTGSTSENFSRELLGLANQYETLLEDPNEKILDKALTFAQYESTDEKKFTMIGHSWGLLLFH